MRKFACFFSAVLGAAAIALFAQNQLRPQHVLLPTSKHLIGSMPGKLGSLNGFTPTIALSPDQRYAAFLNDGYGTQQNQQGRADIADELLAQGKDRGAPSFIVFRVELLEP